MKNIIVKKEMFSPKFFPLLRNYKDRVILLHGGGASGKSYFAFQRAVIKSMSEPNRKTLICRKTLVECRRSCWEDVKRTLNQFQIWDDCEVNKSELTIKLPNGSLFLFMGLDDFSKIKSIPDINDIIVEECTDISLDDFSELKHRTRGKGKLKNQIVMMMNPVSKANWTYSYFFKGECKERDCLLCHSTYKDNPFVSEEIIQVYEDYKETNPLFYAIYCLGEFGSLEKLVYMNWRVEDFDYMEIGGTLRIGLDWGFVSDPTALVCLIQDEANKRLYIFDEWQEKGKTNEQIAKKIIDMGYSKCEIYADSAEQKSIVEVKQNGVRRIKPVTKGQGSIIFGIKKIQEYQIIVHPKCKGVKTELENYAWKKDKSTNEYIEEPVDKNNHFMDALRYSMCEVIFNRKVILMPNVLGL